MLTFLVMIGLVIAAIWGHSDWRWSLTLVIAAVVIDIIFWFVVDYKSDPPEDMYG